jgi:branched-chain amino acid transport system ATP-binding protein
VTATVLDLHDVRSGYGRLEVLRDIALRVDEGEVVAVVGVNGAGKSTLLRTIAGLLPTAAGSIKMRDPGPDRAAFGFAPEGRHLFPAMTVDDNLTLGAFRLSRAHRRAVMASQRALVFDLFPILADMRHRPAGALSGGQQQMVSLGRALMARPQLLLLDEPSMGLAPSPVKTILAALRQLTATGTSVLLVEQVVGLALQASDRAYVLRSGQIVLGGDSSDLLDDSTTLNDAYFGHTTGATQVR